VDEGSSLVGRQLGAYRLEALIGAGAMGAVYRAKDTRLGRDVAVKIPLRRDSTASDDSAQSNARLRAALAGRIEARASGASMNGD